MNKSDELKVVTWIECEGWKPDGTRGGRIPKGTTLNVLGTVIKVVFDRGYAYHDIIFKGQRLAVWPNFCKPIDEG